MEIYILEYIFYILSALPIKPIFIYKEKFNWVIFLLSKYKVSEILIFYSSVLPKSSILSLSKQIYCKIKVFSYHKITFFK